jgi:hypothetical protein
MPVKGCNPTLKWRPTVSALEDVSGRDAAADSMTRPSGLLPATARVVSACAIVSRVRLAAPCLKDVCSRLPCALRSNLGQTVLAPQENPTNISRRHRGYRMRENPARKSPHTRKPLSSRSTYLGAAGSLRQVAPKPRQAPGLHVHGKQGMSGGPQGMSTGPQGMSGGPQGMSTGPQGMSIGPQGMSTGPGALSIDSEACPSGVSA